MGISPRRQLVARSQSTPLERPPRYPLRQIRPLTFPTYTICLTLPKKTKGVKRQIVTDDMGCLLSVVIHKANLHDTKIGWWVAGLAAFTYPMLKKERTFSWLNHSRRLSKD